MENGFETERAVCRFTELMFYFGSHFDADPQYPWAAAYLVANPEPDEPRRSGGLHDEGMRYWGEIAGPDNQYLREAIARILENPLNLMRTASAPTPEAGLPAAFERLYPRKAAKTGRKAMASLVALGLQQAPLNGLTSVEGAVLFTGLMFCLGSGFAHDPIFPWAEAVLMDSSIPDEADAGSAFV